MGAEDYVCIAHAVRAMVLTVRDKRHAAVQLAKFIAQRNERFHRATFLMACGVWRHEDGKPQARSVPADMKEQFDDGPQGLATNRRLRDAT